MKYEQINQEHREVLKRIQDSIPEYLTNAVTKREKASPTVIEMLEKGVKDPEFSEEARRKWQIILDSGVLDKEQDVEVPEIAEEIDAYVELEMQKAIIKGELPKRKKNREGYPKALLRYNKIKQENDTKYERTGN